ncbi:hypothetical protein HMPREF9137_1263 [Prevotella denticola F0289]|nr:hypothetical protein HMPREF9137_1263 [Prevotella denticola F0289]
MGIRLMSGKLDRDNADFISKPSTALKEASETECRPGSV